MGDRKNRNKQLGNEYRYLNFKRETQLITISEKSVMVLGSISLC